MNNDVDFINLILKSATASCFDGRALSLSSKPDVSFVSYDGTIKIIIKYDLSIVF